MVKTSSSNDDTAIDTSVTVGQLSLKNPIVAASGTFGYGVEMSKLIDLGQLGGFVTKGLSSRPRRGNAPPRIHETPSGMLNAIGLHNMGVEAFLKDVLPRLESGDAHIIANVYGETPDDFLAVAERLDDESRISALEVNVSCPNVSKGGLDLGTDPAEVEALLSRISKKTQKPLWAKLTPNVTDIVELAKGAVAGGAQALSLINSVKGFAMDLRTLKPHLSRGIGGLSGPAIKPIAQAKVLEVAQAMNVPILGVGGIQNGKDVLEYLALGASAVQVGTANFMRSDACTFVLDDVKTEMAELGIDALSRYSGAYLRAQSGERR